MGKRQSSHATHGIDYLGIVVGSGRTFVGRTSSFFFIIIYLPTPSRRMDDMECCSIGGRDTEDR